MPGTGSVVMFLDSLTILGDGPSIFVEIRYFLIYLYEDIFIKLDFNLEDFLFFIFHCILM